MRVGVPTEITRSRQREGDDAIEASMIDTIEGWAGMSTLLVCKLRLGWYNVARGGEAERSMTAIWWLIGPALIVLSFVVWVAGMQGKEAILSIGKRTAARSKEAKPKTDVRLANIFSIVIGIVGILVGLTIILLLSL